MTSNTAPSPNVTSASTEGGASYAAWKAFDQTVTTEWSAGYGNNAPWWIQFDFGEGNAEEAVSYTVSASTNSDLYNYMPKTWTLQGSDNGVDWDVLDTQTDVASWTSGEMREYSISSPAAYRYYKLNITAGYSSYVVIGEIELIGGAATSLTDLNVEIKASEEIITDLLSEIIAGVESLTDLNSEIRVGGTSLIDLKSDIAADFLTDFVNLSTEISASAQEVLDLLTEISAGKVSLSDLLSEIITKAQKIYDLKSEIAALTPTIIDLKTSIEAVRSKWWLKSEIKAGCAARYSFDTEWNPNRFLMTEIAAKKPHEFSFNTISGSNYAATSPQIEILTATGTYPLRTLFLDYITPGSENEYVFKLWFARGLGGGAALKNAKIKAEYINTSDAGGFEIVELGIISVKVGDGEYQTVSTTPLLLGDILADSYLDLSLKITIRDCTLSRGLIFFKLILTGDLKESLYSDKVVYGDGSQYFLAEVDDYTSNDFVCRLYIVG